MGSFTVGIEKYIKGRGDDLTVIPRKIVLGIYRGVILDTPVDTGAARGSWQATVGEPASSDIERLDKSGGAAIAEAFAKATVWKPVTGESFFLTSLCPYIKRLNEGSSKQTPARFIERNAMRHGATVRYAEGS